MPIYLGTSKVDDIFLGSDKVKEIYLGTDLVFSSGIPGDPILFNSGSITGIPWRANYITRPNNSSYATGLGNAEVGSTGLSASVGVTTSSNSLRYTSHVCTQNLITIPSSATKLYVQVRKYGDNPDMRFGLLPANASNSLDTSHGGKLDAQRTISVTSWTNYSMNLDSGMAGTNLYRVIINCIAYCNIQGQRNVSKELSIRKVWFE